MRCTYPKGSSLYTSPYQEKSAVMKGQRKPEKCQKTLLFFIMLSGVTREPTHYFLCDNFYQMHCNPELLNFWGPL